MIEFSKQKGLTDLLVEKIVETLEESFPNAPTCHLEPLFRRFANARLHFDADFFDSELQIKNKKDIEEKMNASKTAKAVESLK